METKNDINDYQEGDVVRIKPHLEKSTEGIYITNEMESFQGQNATIKEVRYSPTGFKTYRIKEDGASWLWADYMFDGYGDDKYIISKKTADGSRLERTFKTTTREEQGFYF